MNPTLTPNTQAILLLTAPLLTGGARASADLLTPGEYKRLALRLRELQRQPSDLMGDASAELIRDCQDLLATDRLKRLLERGLQLSQAVDHWQTRAIWVVSRADQEYPRRLKAKLREDAPAVLYGCGDIGLLDKGGLAVVGSRNVSPELLAYADSVGRLCAEAGQSVVSGGARGIDQASMRGALEAEGRAVGILADTLERAALARENRALLMDERLVLVSPYDPSAGFNVGHAMQRNKLIYAFADAALVVNSDFQKGGTWAGAVEQLDKLRLVPVYVRTPGSGEKGMEGLRRKGANLWPENMAPRDLITLLAESVLPRNAVGDALGLTFGDEADSLPRDGEPMGQVPPSSEPDEILRPAPPVDTPPSESQESPQECLFGTVRQLALRLAVPLDEAALAEALGIQKAQAKLWLARLIQEGVVKKAVKKRGKGPKAPAGQRPLFEDQS